MTYFFSFINIIGGLALFLFGVEQSSLYFRGNLGAESRELMGRFTRKKYQAFAIGMLLSALTQSSTIATSFAVGFVDVGLLSFAGSLIVMMGASLGGTFVSFLLSLNLFAYAPLLFGMSFFLGKLKNSWVRRVCGLLKCLSLIFMGMLILGYGTGPLFQDESFRNIVIRWASNGWIMGVAAFVGSGVLQSSSAIMALGIALSASNVLPSSSALPIALGAHIGSTTMVVLAGMSGSMNAQRLGYATFFFKLLGGLAFLCVAPFVHSWMSSHGYTAAQELVYGQVLIASFNIALFYPFPGLLSRLSGCLINSQGNLSEPRYLDEELLSVPKMAVMLLSKEMARLSNYMEAYLQMLLEPQQRDKAFFDQLPRGIEDLCGACQEYAYKVKIPSDDLKLSRDFATISYTMSILRGMQKLLCGGIKSGLEAESMHSAFQERLGAERWEQWCKLSRKCMRSSLRAFVIGEKGLVAQGSELEQQLA
ncbi:MAG: Na/Pi symporter, partial [Pyramidobacter sp.]|nr:Na/Pi symporter [Pyramidobacter sp.]